jgi:hypothetical protein
MVAQLKNLMGMGVLVLAILGCQPGTSVTQAAPVVDNSAALTLTSLVQTLTAPPSTPTPVVIGDVSATLPAEGFPTATEFSSTVEAAAAPVNMTAIPSTVPGPSVPMASVTVGTNCRSGPGREYVILGGAQVGVKFLLVGKNTQTNYWIIRLPDGGECWLWGEHAVVEGDVASLPEYAIPAPPPPQFGSIEGVVDLIRGSGQIPDLSGIDVIVMPAGIRTKTDSSGAYFFDSVPVGEVRITFSYPFLIIPDINNVIVQAGQRTVAAPAQAFPPQPY